MDLFLGGLAGLFVFMAVLPLGLIVLGLAVVFNGRRDADPTGRRPTAIYLGVVCFVALFTVLFASTAAVGRLASLIVPEDAREDRLTSFVEDGVDGYWIEAGPDYVGPRGHPRRPDAPDPDDVAVRDTVRAGLVALPAAAVLAFHWRRRRRLLDEPDFADSAAWRADRVYLYLVCLVAAGAATFASATLVFDAFRIAAPDITSAAGERPFEREQALADLLAMAVLTAGSVVIFFSHWSAVSGEANPLRRLRPRRRSRSGADEPEELDDPSPPPT